MPEREGRGWPTTDDLKRTTVRHRHASDKRASRKQIQTDVMSTKTGVDRHLKTYMVAEFARQSHGDRTVKQSTRSRLVNRFEVEVSRIIKKIAQRNGTITPEKINQVSWNETEYTKILRISTRTKLLICLLQCSERSLRIKRHIVRVSTSEFGLEIRYGERAY